tara:strand:+ start:865 stop:1011 length:147 start_codon:yes stop_codon:yes gene_type:complete
MSSAKIRIILGVLPAKQLITVNRKERRIRFVFIGLERTWFFRENKLIK